MMRDEAIAGDLYKIVEAISQWEEKLDILSRGAREEGAEQHARLYGMVSVHLGTARRSAQKAATIMDPVVTEVETF